MSANQSLLELLLEVQRLDRVPRTGFLLRGLSDVESVSEHAFQVAFLVWAVGPQIPGLEVPRALELALLHDLAEVRLGDLPRAAGEYLPAGAKDAAERHALDDLLAPVAQRAAPLIDEYLESRTPEARFARACDRLQLLLKVTAYERGGAAGLEEFWRGQGMDVFDAFPPLRRLAEELYRGRSSR